MNLTKNKSLDDIATRLMFVMVRMPPTPHKDAPKVDTPKGKAQRLRRERERRVSSHQATCAD
jgi:hypothetical protein